MVLEIYCPHCGEVVMEVDEVMVRENWWYMDKLYSDLIKECEGCCTEKKEKCVEDIENLD